MVTEKALSGKPYAGNSQVQFDEEEVASATMLRQRSLLYDFVLRWFRVIICIMPILYGGLILRADSWIRTYDADKYWYLWYDPYTYSSYPYVIGWWENGVNYLFNNETFANCYINSYSRNGSQGDSYREEVYIKSEIMVSYQGKTHTFKCPILTIERNIEWDMWTGTIEEYQERYFRKYGTYHSLRRGYGLDMESSPKRIIFDDGIKYIAPNSFEDGFLIQSVRLPKHLTRIEDRTFYRCYALEDINLSDSIYYIGNSAFAGCSNLTSVTWPQSLRTIGNSAFAMDEFGYGCGLTSAILPEGVEHIGDYAFRGPWNGNGLVDVYIPDSCTNIGVCAFQYCRKLRNIRLPVNIKPKIVSWNHKRGAFSRRDKAVRPASFAKSGSVQSECVRSAT